MFKRYLIAFALIAGLATPANAQAPGAWTKVGMLRCILDPSVGFIITGHESMQCSFAQSAGGPQAYEGAINMVGLDVISTAAGGVFEWAVFAPTTGTPAGALAGEYVGASGDLGYLLAFQPMSSSAGRDAPSPCSRSRWEDRLPSKSPWEFPFLSCAQVANTTSH